MKKFILTLLILSISIIYAGNGVVLHPNLSYRSVDDLETVVEKHTFGDQIELTGEEVTNGDTKYLVFTKDGKKYASYFYYLLDNVVDGAVTKTTYIYSYNDLSAITNMKLNPLQFVAVDKNSMKDRLVKVYYLVWDSAKNSGVIKEGWIKSTSISTSPDDWKSSAKYFLAKNEENPDMKKSYLSGILKFHKKSTFVSLVQDMIDNNHLRVEKIETGIDPIFVGTKDTLLNPYIGKLFKDQSTDSEILTEGTFKIKLIGKSKDTFIYEDSSEYMYYVEIDGLKGWIHGLN